MKIDIIISAADIKENKIAGKTVIVIDMLRATSVIVTALNNGCSKVIPFLTVEEATAFAEKNRQAFILGGERKAIKIQGFDCSNSPLEYKKELVEGKTLVMTTTNGTRAINACKEASNILIGALINAASVAKKAMDINKDIVIVNAGTDGQFSIDDFICSGYIIENIINHTKDVFLTDISTTANYVYKSNPDIISFIKNATHYKRILELELFEDLEYCCKKDIVNIVPEFKNGIIS